MKFSIRPPFLKFNRGYQEKFKDKFVEWRYMYNQGMGYWDLVQQPAKVLVVLGAVIYLDWIPKWVLVAFVPAWYIIWSFIGWYDRYHLKIWQRQAEWSSRTINPFEKEIMRRIRNIERIVKK